MLALRLRDLSDPRQTSTVAAIKSTKCYLTITNDAVIATMDAANSSVCYWTGISKDIQNRSRDSLLALKECTIVGTIFARQ